MAGQRGPVGKPLHLVEVDGNPGHLTKAELEKRARAERRVVEGAPETPAGMSREWTAEWKRVVPRLANAGMLSPVDRALVMAWCDNHESLRIARADLKKFGHFVEGATGGVVRNPAWSVAREATGLLVQLAGKLGLSYVDRVRLGDVGVMPEDDDGPADGGLERDFEKRLQG